MRAVRTAMNDRTWDKKDEQKAIMQWLILWSFQKRLKTSSTVRRSSPNRVTISHSRWSPLLKWFIIQFMTRLFQEINIIYSCNALITDITIKAKSWQMNRTNQRGLKFFFSFSRSTRVILIMQGCYPNL